MPRLQPARLGNVPGEGYMEIIDRGRGHLRGGSGVFHPKSSRGAEKLRRMHGEEAMTRFSGMVYNEGEEHRLTFDATITDPHIGGENDTIRSEAKGNPFDSSRRAGAA